MGNGVTSTDSIRAQKRQERYDAKVAREKEKIAKKAEEIKAKAEKEKAAAELARTIAGDSNHIESSTVKQYVKDELKTQYKNGEITKEEYKAAKDFATSHDYKKELKQNENDFASRVVARFAKDSDGLNARAVRSDVKADLKDHFDKDSEIYQVAEKYATKGSVVGRFFDKKSDSRVMFEAKSQRNNVEKVKAEGPDFSARQQARLEAAGYNTSDVYALADEAGGKYDGTIQYSYKDGENEIKKSVELFNNNENGVEFSRHQVKKLMRDAGYKVENKVSVGELAKDMLKGAVAGAPFSYINAGQSQATTVNGIADIVNNQNVEIIGDHCFYSCPSLSTINFGSGSKLETISDSVFESCPELRTITLPSLCHKIGTNTFKSCTNLYSIKHNLNEIGANAFTDCTSIISFEVTAELNSVNPSAFFGCTKFVEFIDCTSETKTQRRAQSTQTFSVVNGTLYNLEGTVLMIYPTGRKIAEIPKETQSIDTQCFFSCTMLQYVQFETNSQIREFSNNLFSKCTDLTQIRFPESLETIGNMCFSGCSKLKYVVLPISLTSIGENAFSECSELKIVKYCGSDIVTGNNVFHDNLLHIYYLLFYQMFHHLYNEFFVYYVNPLVHRQLFEVY